VPGDRLALAIRVGGEDELVGIFDGVGNFPDDFLRLTIHVPVHVEVVVGFHRAILGRQVADVPIGGDDLVGRPQVLVDGLRLGGGFHDDNVHLRLS